MATFNQNKYYTGTSGNSSVVSNQPSIFGSQPSNFWNPTTKINSENVWSNAPLFGSTTPQLQTPLFGSTTPQLQTPLFGSTTPQLQTPLFGSTTPQQQSTFQTPLFGSTTPQQQSTFQTPLFGSTTPQQPSTFQTPLFGSTTPQLQTPLFGSTRPQQQSTFQTPLFGSSMYNVASNVNLVELNLPKNKIEGLIFMVSLDQKNTLFNTKSMIENAFTKTVLPIENLWFNALVKYSDEKFILQRVNENHVQFSLLYSSLLRELMVESINTPDQLYSWLLDFAKIQKNRKMLWLFSILKLSSTNQFYDILDLTNALEVFVWALHTFILTDNKPTETVELAKQSSNSLYKTFLLSMVGASYGRSFMSLNGQTNQDLTDLVSKFK